MGLVWTAPSTVAAVRWYRGLHIPRAGPEQTDDPVVLNQAPFHETVS